MVNIIVAALAGGVACGIGLAWALLPTIPLAGPPVWLALASLAAVAAVAGIRFCRQPAPTPPLPPPPDHSQEMRQLLAALDRLHHNRVAAGGQDGQRQLVKGE